MVSLTLCTSPKLSRSPQLVTAFFSEELQARLRPWLLWLFLKGVGSKHWTQSKKDAGSQEGNAKLSELGPTTLQEKSLHCSSQWSSSNFAGGGGSCNIEAASGERLVREMQEWRCNLPVLTDSRGWKDGTSSAFITITPGAISNAYVPRPQKLKQLMDLRPVLLFSLAILSNTMFGAGRLGDCTNEIDDVMLYTRPRYMWQDSGQNLHLQRSFFCVHFLFSGVAPWPILNPLEPQSSSLSGSRAWRHNESFSALVDLFGPPSPPVSNCKKNW